MKLRGANPPNFRFSPPQERFSLNSPVQRPPGRRRAARRGRGECTELLRYRFVAGQPPAPGLVESSGATIGFGRSEPTNHQRGRAIARRGELDSAVKRAQPRRELEAKLVARDAALLDSLAELPAIGDFTVQHVGERALHDRHFDTTDQALGSRGIGLRIREQDDQSYFTLKWPNTASGSLYDRPELELPVSRSAWRRVRELLQQAGVHLTPRANRATDPERWLEADGLRLTQERWTRRTVLIACRNGRPFAELALDRVRYRFGIYEVAFNEVEIEAIGGDELDVLAVARLLERSYPDRLAPSQRGKYARGLVLAAALEPLQG